MDKTIHHGNNVKRFREMFRIKQEGLAHLLGEEWTQKRISALEQKEVIDDALLEEVARHFKVTAEAIKNFDEEQAINIISNTFNEGSFVNTGFSPTFNINPIEKWIDALEENKKLYERLLAVEREKNELLERVLNK